MDAGPPAGALVLSSPDAGAPAQLPILAQNTLPAERRGLLLGRLGARTQRLTIRNPEDLVRALGMPARVRNPLTGERALKQAARLLGVRRINFRTQMLLVVSEGGANVGRSVEVTNLDVDDGALTVFWRVGEPAAGHGASSSARLLLVRRFHGPVEFEPHESGEDKLDPDDDGYNDPNPPDPVDSEETDSGDVIPPPSLRTQILVGIVERNAGRPDGSQDELSFDPEPTPYCLVTNDGARYDIHFSDDRALEAMVGRKAILIGEVDEVEGTLGIWATTAGPLSAIDLIYGEGLPVVGRDDGAPVAAGGFPESVVLRRCSHLSRKAAGDFLFFEDPEKPSFEIIRSSLSRAECITMPTIQPARGSAATMAAEWKDAIVRSHSPPHTLPLSPSAPPHAASLPPSDCSSAASLDRYTTCSASHHAPPTAHAPPTRTDSARAARSSANASSPRSARPHAHTTAGFPAVWL